MLTRLSMLSSLEGVCSGAIRICCQMVSSTVLALLRFDAGRLGYTTQPGSGGIRTTQGGLHCWAKQAGKCLCIDVVPMHMLHCTPEQWILPLQAGYSATGMLSTWGGWLYR